MLSCCKMKHHNWNWMLWWASLSVVLIDHRSVAKDVSVQKGKGLEVNIGVLLPLDDVALSKEPCFSIRHLLPTSELAIREAGRLFPTSVVSKIKVWFVDSNCSDTYGPLNAMRLLLNPDIYVHAFFGPCCKYALSPVARYTRVWHTPIITPGGLTPAFSNKRDFPLLTRIMAPYDKLASFVVSIMEYYRWSTFSLLWHDHHLRKSLGKSECYHTADALIRVTRSHKLLHEPYKETFDEGYIHSFDWNSMLAGIKNHSRSKSISTFDKLWTAENYGDLNSRSNCISLSRRALMFAQFSLSS